MVYMIQLTLIRINCNGEQRLKDDEVGAQAWKIDKSMLILFASLYILFNVLYWPVCLSN